jgi:large subunit ribosomal protein L6
MSRVGKKPLDIPQGVKVTVAGRNVKVEGPKGSVQRDMHPDIRIAVDGGKVSVSRPSDLRLHRCLHGTTQRLIGNMITGVTKGYLKRLEIIGIGYGAKMEGADLVINIGFTHPIRVLVPKGLQVSCPATTMIAVEGADKEQVGPQGDQDI